MYIYRRPSPLPAMSKKNANYTTFSQSCTPTQSPHVLSLLYFLPYHGSPLPSQGPKKTNPPRKKKKGTAETDPQHGLAMIIFWAQTNPRMHKQRTAITPHHIARGNGPTFSNRKNNKRTNSGTYLIPLALIQNRKISTSGADPQKKWRTKPPLQKLHRNAPKRERKQGEREVVTYTGTFVTQFRFS